MARKFVKNTSNVLEASAGTIAGRINGLGATKLSGFAWVNVNSTTASAVSDNCIVSILGSNGSTNVLIRMGIDAFTGPGVYFRAAIRGSAGDATAFAATGGYQITLGRWHSVAFIMDLGAGTLRTYVNGKRQAESTGASLTSPFSSVSTPSSNDGVGCDTSSGGPTTNQQLDGMLEHVALWMTDIGDANILRMHRGESPGRIAPNRLAMYLPLVQDAAASAMDHAPLARVAFSVTGTLAVAQGRGRPIQPTGRGRLDRSRVTHIAVAKTLTTTADAAILDTVTKTTQGDAAVQDALALTAQGDVAIKETVAGTAQGDAYVQWWPTTAFRAASAAFDVLVEIDWPGGARRYAGHDLAVETTGYDGRLISVGRIVQGTEDRQDAVTITLENTTTGGSIESTWSDANPPEGAEVRVYYWFSGDVLAQRMLLFRGIVSEVTEVTEQQITLSAASYETKYDVPLGTLINTTDFPSAPNEAIGKLKPIVFGTIDRFEGIPVTTIARTTTASSVLAEETSIAVADTSELPSSGTVLIGGTELVTYTGISGSDLTGCTRGASGTTAADCGSGTDVVFYGELDILIAGHAITAITAVYGVVGTRVALLDPSTYTKQLTTPGMIKFATGWPTISVPSGTLETVEIQLDSIDAVNNTAKNPIFAAGGDTDWQQMNAAQVNASTGNQTLSLYRAASYAPQGELVRAWLVCEFDDTPFPLAAGTVQMFLLVGGTGGTLLGPLATLQKGGNVSTALRDLLGLGEVRLWDATHAHSVVNSSTSTSIAAPSSAPTATNGSAGWSSLGNTVDQNFSTFSLSASHGGGPSFYDFGSLNFSHSGTAWGFTTTGKTITRIRAHAKYGQTPGSPPLYTNPANLNLRISGSNVSSVFMPGTGNATEYITPWWTAASWTDLTNATIELQTIPQSVSWGHNVTDVWIEFEYATTTTSGDAVVATQPAIYSTAMVYDVGGLGVQPTWADLLAPIVIIGATSTTVDVNIIRCYWLAEVSPFKPTPAERVLVDVQGLQANGDPIEILKQVMTNAYLLGQPSSSYSAGDFAVAQAKLQAIGYRQDFAITDQMNAGDLISMIAQEARLLRFWESGALCVVYRENLANLPVAVITLRDDDVTPDPVSRGRTSIDEVVTQLVASYRYDYVQQDESRTVTSTLTVPLSTRPAAQTFTTIRDDATASSLATLLVERAAKPRYVIQFTGYLPLLDVRRGDIIALVAGRLNYAKLEVVEISIDAHTVQLKATVWDSI